MKFQLITSYSSQRVNGPKLYMGHWCKEIQNLSLIERRKKKINIYNLKKSEKEFLQNKIKFLEEKLIIILTSIFNQKFRLNYKKNYYEIIFKHWLRRYISVFINRLYNTKDCIKKNKDHISKIHLNPVLNINPPKNSEEAIRYFDLHEVNDWIYKICFQELKFNKPIILNEKKINFKYPSKKIGLLNKFINFVNNIIISFSKNDKIFIMNSYLGICEEIKLNISFFQFPKIYKDVPIRPKKSNFNLRNFLKSELLKFCENKEEKFICKYLFDFMPISYIENFENYRNIIDKINWPKNPRVIFTSNSFDTNETFKYYTAEIKSRKKCKYIIGQHGAGYNLNDDKFTHVEREISDHTIVWGRKINLNDISGCVLKRYPLADINNNKKFIIISPFLDFRINFFDSHNEFLNQYNFQINFLNQIKRYGKDKFTLRLKHNKEMSIKVHFKDVLKFKNIKIDLCEKKFENVFNKYNLVICFYLSTVFLEMISINYPVILCVTDTKNIPKKYKKLFKKLKEIGVIHSNEFTLVKFLDNNHKNISKWWFKDLNQSYLKEFRKEFCRERNIFKVKKIIKSSSEKNNHI